MNSVEQKDFVNSYISRMGNIDGDIVEKFVKSYFGEGTSFNNETGMILDAIGIWKDARDFEKKTSAMTFVERVFTENTGGGCMVDFIQLKDGRCIGINEECLVVYPSYNIFYHDHISTISFPLIEFKPTLREKHESYCPANDGFGCKCWDIDYIAEVALNSACAKIQEMLDVPTGDLAGEVFGGQEGEDISEILRKYIAQEMDAKLNGR